MRQRLTTVDMSIEEMLSGQYCFSIPAYQRDYSWSKDEAGQLVDDIGAALEDVTRDGADIPYFLGTMLFVERPDDAGEAPEPRSAGPAPRRVDVVDGQQRLITLTILFAVLRDMLAEDEAQLQNLISEKSAAGPPLPYLRLRASDAGFFEQAIQHPGSTRRAQAVTEIGTSLARRNIEDVRRAIRSKLQREIGVEQRQLLAQFARRHVRILVVSSDDFDYAYQIFLTINDRGKRLSVEDIFRGEILGPLDRNQRERYEAIIDEMEKYREEAEASRAKGKTFFTHLATIDGWPRRGIIDGLKRAVVKRGGPRRFVSDVFAPMAEAYLQVKGADIAAPTAVEAAHWLTALRWLEMHGDDDWVPLAMIGLRQLGGDGPALALFLRALDRYAHGLMALGCGKEARRKHYTPILKRLIEEPRMPAPDDLFAITPANQKAILRNIATRIHVIDPPTARLVLLRADQALSGRPLAYYQPYLALDRRDSRRFTVEHVCPKGEVKDGYWADLFPRRALRLRVAQCIGNLVLITEAQNKRVGQKSFGEKKWIFFPDGTSSPFHLTEMLRTHAEWDGAAIDQRYKLVMQAVAEMWSLDGPIPKCPAAPALG